MLNYKELEELRGWVLGHEWEWFATFNANIGTRSHRLSPDFMTQQRSLLKRWHANVDRKILGRDWSSFPSTERTQFIAFPERGPKGDLVHWHTLVKSPRAESRETFRRHAVEAFKMAWLATFTSTNRLQRENEMRGQLDLKPFHEASIYYSTKKLWTNFGAEYFILSQEFQR